MGELPPDRERLIAIRIYLELQLARVRAALAELDAADSRPAPRAQQPAAPRADPTEWHPSTAGSPPRDDSLRWWQLETGTPAILHRGDCTTGPRGAPLNRTEARMALKEPNVRACARCRPDLGLD